MVMNNTHDLATNIIELDLEQIILSRVINACDHNSENIEKVIEVLAGLKTEHFSSALHRDIFLYYSQEIKKDTRASAFYHLLKYLCDKPQWKQQQHIVKQSVNNLKFFFPDDLSLLGLPLAQLSQDLIKWHKERKIKASLSNSENIDFDYVSELLKDLEPTPKTSAADKLKSSIDELLNATSPYDAALIKRQLRQGMGLTPQEILEVVEAEAAAALPSPQVQRGVDFLQKDFGTSSWIYPGIIPANGCILINGLPGSMKTMFSYALLMSYLNNLPFLGEAPSSLCANPNKRGLIINADQQPSEAKDMLSQSPLVWAAGDSWDMIGGNPQEGRWTLQYLPMLEEQIKVMGYTMIIVDSYVKVHSHLPKWDENKAEGALGMNAFQDLASKYNCTFIIIHHANKDESSRGVSKGRGATYIPGAASAVMNLDAPKPDKNGNLDPLVRFLEIAKLRNATASKLIIRFNPQTYSFDLLPDNQGQERLRLNHIADNLYTQIFVQNANEKYTVERIMNNLHVEIGGDRKAFAYKILNKLEQRGLINKSVDPHDYKRRLYSFKVQNPERVLDEDVDF